MYQGRTKISSSVPGEFEYRSQVKKYDSTVAVKLYSIPHYARIAEAISRNEVPNAAAVCR